MCPPPTQRAPVRTPCTRCLGDSQTPEDTAAAALLPLQACFLLPQPQPAPWLLNTNLESSLEERVSSPPPNMGRMPAASRWEFMGLHPPATHVATQGRRLALIGTRMAWLVRASDGRPVLGVLHKALAACSAAAQSVRALMGNLRASLFPCLQLLVPEARGLRGRKAAGSVPTHPSVHHSDLSSGSRPPRTPGCRPEGAVWGSSLRCASRPWLGVVVTTVNRAALLEQGSSTRKRRGEPGGTSPRLPDESNPAG